MTTWRMLIMVAALPVLAGCAGGSIASIALELAGIRKTPELPDAQKPPRRVPIRLHAGENLNTGAGSQPLAVVARIYKLRQASAFERVAYDGFLDPQRERELLGPDLIEVREVLLIPGQRYEVIEKVSREAYFIGVVALFRHPAAQRWRVAFAAGEAEKAGITVGLHACALSVGAGAPSALASAEANARPLAGLRCG